jgi:hypothetical protein
MEDSFARGRLASRRNADPAPRFLPVLREAAHGLNVPAGSEHNVERPCHASRTRQHRRLGDRTSASQLEGGLSACSGSASQAVCWNKLLGLLRSTGRGSP